MTSGELERREPRATGELVLGIDAGGSSTRWLLLDAQGETVASGRVGPVSGIDLANLDLAKLEGRDGEVVPALSNLAQLADACLAVGVPVGVAAGVTGLDSFSPLAKLLERYLAERLGIDVEQVSVLGDVVTAYLAAFEPGQGVLVYAGTGSVALHMARNGMITRAGGHGYLVDDAGGGYWIGREALKRVLRRADASGSPPAGNLATAVYRELGGSDWPTLRASIYGGGRSRLASLTPLVAHAADRGDPDALAVLDAAGNELARLANVVTGRLGQLLPIALAGGVAACGRPLLGALRAALPITVDFSVAAMRPVEAAARLASRLRDGTVSVPVQGGLKPPG